MNKRYLPTFCMCLAILLSLAACNPGTGDNGQDTATATATTVAQPEDAETPDPTTTNTPEPEAPTATATAVTLEPTATDTIAATEEPAQTSEPVAYQVVFVEEDDTLNVRDGAGVDSEVVGELAPAADGITLGSQRAIVDGSEWAVIESDSVEGWVNTAYLTQSVDPSAFCNDAEAQALLDTFLQEAAAGELDESIHAGRGLRVRMHWWNPEVIIGGETLRNVYASDESYEWGTEDGSGFPIVGTFAEVVAPLLEEDLLGGSEIGCNEILHGNTTGLVQLPDGYQAVNYYSLHRPAPEDGVEFDWGSWVIGVEKWDGEYFVSFLIHFEWEI